MPYSYDPRALLDQHKEVWMSLGINLGEPFRSHAASELLRGLKYSETYFWMLVSAMSRGDREACRKFVNDWGGCKQREVVNISKFIPGEHYHALGIQFNSIEAAEKHIRSQGKIPGSLIEKHVYVHEGD